jgi:hypothetical protein
VLTRLRQLPSPALVIGSIALILALGGGSFALATSDNSTDKKIAKKVADKQITKRAPGLSVKHATSADTAATLQGKGPGAFVQGTGSVIVGRLDAGFGSTTGNVITVPGVGILSLSNCSNSGTPHIDTSYKNTSGGIEDFSFRSHGITFTSSLNNGTTDLESTNGTVSGDQIEYEIATRGSSPTVATLTATVSLVSGAADCVLFAQATTGS